MERENGGIIGTIASIIAAIIIAYILIVIGLEGITSAFNPPTLYLMILLLLSGIGALYGYIHYSEISYKYMRALSPLALMIAGLGIYFGMDSPTIGGGLIVLAYVVEYIVGYHLARDFKKDSPIGTKFFLAGVTIYMLALPFIIISRYIAFISLIGDIIKLYGLIIIAQGIYETTRKVKSQL